MIKADITIFGTGIAGLNTACQLAKLRPDLSIFLISKGSVNESNSKKAQGGIAISPNIPHKLESHVTDTYIAGNEHSSKEDIRKVLISSPEVLGQLKLYGLQFDQDNSGELDLAIEGGHSEHRIIHVKDRTGAAVTDSMLSYAHSCKNITILEHHNVIDIKYNQDKSKRNTSTTALLINSKTLGQISITASISVIAMGGVGSLYSKTTNSDGSNGEGIFLANKIGLEINDMEFIQFHPTGLYRDTPGSCHLISEAVRGKGGILINHNGERFMTEYDSRLELAPRDIVSRAIAVELNNSSRKYVYLDCTHFKKGFFKNRFPEIYKICIENGVDPELNKIPVAPVQHFICGGIVTDEFGRTNYENVFAVGECARTGLHGSNRLASNSLLECIIISKRIAEMVATHAITDNNTTNAKLKFLELHEARDWELNKIELWRIELQQLMLNEAGILRTNYGLNVAEETISKIHSEANAFIEKFGPSLESLELCSMLNVAALIISAAKLRRENLGGHFNINHESSDWLSHLINNKYGNVSL